MRTLGKKLLVLVAGATLLLGLVACVGGSDADKAYDAWATNSAPKVQKATTDYSEKLAAGDVTAVREYLAIVEEITNELAAIDQSQLSSVRKTAAEEQLTSLQASVQQLKDSLVTLEGLEQN
ncbi:MAG: hypothetical protein LBI99_00350 [Propionibacteriaceae bacterium]|jgi:hypothetical protein|nr:hypothetical protein [Propionibacteriaceae bacterium]